MPRTVPCAVHAPPGRGGGSPEARCFLSFCVSLLLLVPCFFSCFSASSFFFFLLLFFVSSFFSCSSLISYFFSFFFFSSFSSCGFFFHAFLFCVLIFFSSYSVFFLLFSFFFFILTCCRLFSDAPPPALAARAVYQANMLPWKPRFDPLTDRPLYTKTVIRRPKEAFTRATRPVSYYGGPCCSNQDQRWAQKNIISPMFFTRFWS